MNEKLTAPIMKRSAKIDVSIEKTGYISFWADADIANEFAQFGKMEQFTSTPNKHFLYVDGRFDFDEVAAYIENFCQGGSR